MPSADARNENEQADAAGAINQNASEMPALGGGIESQNEAINSKPSEQPVEDQQKDAANKEGKDEADAEKQNEVGVTAGEAAEKDQKATDEGQTATTVPDSESKDIVAASATPEKPKKPKMTDWADDDSDYDEEEEFNYNKQQDNDEGPCEDDHIKLDSPSYKARDGRRVNRKMQSKNEYGANDDLQFLTEEINGRTNGEDGGPNYHRGKDESKEAELKEDGYQRPGYEDSEYQRSQNDDSQTARSQSNQGAIGSGTYYGSGGGQRSGNYYGSGRGTGHRYQRDQNDRGGAPFGGEGTRSSFRGSRGRGHYQGRGGGGPGGGRGGYSSRGNYEKQGSSSQQGYDDRDKYRG